MVDPIWTDGTPLSTIHERFRQLCKDNDVEFDYMKPRERTVDGKIFELAKQFCRFDQEQNNTILYSIGINILKRLDVVVPYTNPKMLLDPFPTVLIDELISRCDGIWDYSLLIGSLVGVETLFVDRIGDEWQDPSMIIAFSKLLKKHKIPKIITERICREILEKLSRRCDPDLSTLTCDNLFDVFAQFFPEYIDRWMCFNSFCHRLKHESECRTRGIQPVVDMFFHSDLCTPKRKRVVQLQS